MKSRIIVTAVCMQLVACASWQYPNWEYVRIEDQVPAESCVYKMQEACSQRANTCLNWHKKRATNYGANTVVITHSETQSSYKAGLFRASGSENSSTVAEYYYCNTPKNITPK